MSYCSKELFKLAYVGSQNVAYRARCNQPTAESLNGFNLVRLENTPPDDAVHPEIGMLTEQLKKLDQSNGRLQDELVELRQQLVAARQKKKGA